MWENWIKGKKTVLKLLCKWSRWNAQRYLYALALFKSSKEKINFPLELVSVLQLHCSRFVIFILSQYKKVIKFFMFNGIKKNKYNSINLLISMSSRMEEVKVCNITIIVWLNTCVQKPQSWCRVELQVFRFFKQITK